jgi:hypothetical protein
MAVQTRPSMWGAVKTEAEIEAQQVMKKPLSPKSPAALEATAFDLLKHMPTDLVAEIANGLAEGKTGGKVVPFVKAQDHPAAREKEVISLLLEFLKYSGLPNYEAATEEREAMVKLGRIRLPATKVATLLMELLRAKLYKVPATDASRWRRFKFRAGVLFEYLLPFFPKTLEAEEEAAFEIGSQIIEERAAGKLTAAQITEQKAALRAALRNRFGSVGSDQFESIVSDTGAQEAAVVEDGEIGPNLYMMALTRVRSVNGKELSDHLRVLVSPGKNGGWDVWPVSVGESKFGDDPGRVLRQIPETFARLAKGLRASNLDTSKPIQIRWGPKLVAIAQSEAEFPEGAEEAIRTKVAAAIDRPLESVKSVLISAPEEAQAARDVTEALVDATLGLFHKNFDAPSSP